MSNHTRIIFSILILTVISASGFIYWQKYQADSGFKNAMRTSLTDQRLYQKIKLSNGLSVLLVSDPETESSAAALKVNVGSWHNPVEIPGLAHFLEHMLFLGTEKYPDPDEYSDFMQTHGGSQNAYTASEETAYFFNIESSHFEEGLDRFSQFFIAPNFDANLVEREKNAVDAEFNSGLQQDSRRIYDAYQTALNQDHPDALFSTGNLETLNRENLRDELISFFKQYYSADQMTLVVYSNEDIETLTKMVTDRFEKIERTSTTPLVVPPLFNSNQLPAYLQVKAIKDLRELTFAFTVPGPNNYLESKPGKLISWILNQETIGSLVDILKKQGLADSLHTGTTSNTKSETTFDITIQITREGEKQLDKIGILVFDAIQQIQRDRVPQWKFDEIKRLQELRFNFQEAYNPMSYVVRLASQIGWYSDINSLFGPYNYPQLDLVAVETYLSRLTSENLLVTFASPNAKTTDQTKYYETDFSLNKLPDDWLAQWNDVAISSLLSAPQRNEFIPESLEIFPTDQKPSILYPYLPDTSIDEPGLKFWFLQNNEFISPKVDTRVVLQSEWFRSTTAQKAATALYLELVKDSLDEVSRDASLAGLGYGLWLDSQGVALRIYGYQDKLSLYADVIANELVSHEINPERLALIKDRLIRQYNNQKKDRLTSQMYRQLAHFITENHSNGSQMALALKTVSMDDLNKVKSQLNGSVSIQMLTVGNQLVNVADKMARRLAANFSVSTEEQSGTESVMVLNRLSAHYEFDSNQSDSGILIYYQGESDSFREQALYSLISQMTESQFYNQLRTEKQLGYVVQATEVSFHQLPGMGFIIQSPNTDPGLLLLHIDKFIREHLLWLNSLDEETFEQYKSGLISQLTEPDNNLLEKSSRYWSNIRYAVPHFNRQKRIALEVEKISQTGLIRFYQNQLVSSDAKRLIVYHVGDDHQQQFDKNHIVRPGERVLQTAEKYQENRPSLKF